MKLWEMEMGMSKWGLNPSPKVNKSLVIWFKGDPLERTVYWLLWIYALISKYGKKKKKKTANSRDHWTLSGHRP